MVDFGGAAFFFFPNMTATGMTMASTNIVSKAQNRYFRMQGRLELWSALVLLLRLM